MTTSDRIDQIVTNRILGIPIFILVMWAVYYVSVTTVGTWVTDWTNDVFVVAIQDLWGGFLNGIGAGHSCAGPCCKWYYRRSWSSSWLRSADGDPVPVSFNPGRLRLYGAYCLCYGPCFSAISDFAGKSFIPLLISSGCGIPGIMASRTIEQDNDQTSYNYDSYVYPCERKLPVIALMGGVIAGERGGWTETPSLHL